MATIIIRGDKEESSKMLNVLKEKFPVFEKKAGYQTEGEQTTIVEVFAEDFNLKEYTAQETLKALRCCSNAERDCSSCPYRRVQQCVERLKIDGAVVVNRLFNGKTE